MGGIITTTTISRQYPFDLTLFSLYPEYFNSSLRKKDLIVCSTHWQQIMMGNCIPYKENIWIQRCFESCKVWLNHVILNELFATTKIHLKSSEDREIFLKSMFAMIVVNLKEWDDPLSQDKTIEILCQRVMRLGFNSNYFIAFGPAFFSGLRTISGINFSSEIEESWKNVYSSVLSITIPFLLRSGGLQKPAPNLQTTIGFTTFDLNSPCEEQTKESSSPLQSILSIPNYSRMMNVRNVWSERMHATPHNYVDLNEE